MTLGLFIRDAGNVPREISELIIRDAANVARTISELWIRDANNTPRLVFNPSGSASLSVELNADNVVGFSAGSGTATTDEAIATATGGTAPYTYAWTLVSSPNPCVANFPALGTTDFTMTGMDPANSFIAVWLVTATDANSNTATNTIQAIFSDIGGIM